MPRYIDANELIFIGLDNPDDDHLFEFVPKEFIDNAPTADVVEVVRCKDCKFRKIEFGWNGKKYKMCANTDYPTDDDAYCSYGERREQ